MSHHDTECEKRAAIAAAARVAEAGRPVVRSHERLRTFLAKGAPPAVVRLEIAVMKRAMKRLRETVHAEATRGVP